MLDSPASRLLRFDAFTLDLTRCVLLRGGEALPLRRQSFDVLRTLAERRGGVVSKDDLLKAVWPGVKVTDDSIVQCVKEIRQALGADARWIVRTVPGRGYEFMAAVATARHPGATAAGDGTPPALQLPELPSIAVLAFANMTGDPKQEYLADGISDEIITELSRFSDLFVIARNSSFTYKGKDVDIRQVGRELGVRYVLEGSIHRAADYVRIAAHLVDAASGTHRWAERYERPFKDTFEIRDEVTRTIVAILAAHVNKAEVERALLKPAATWQAYDYYLRAASFFSSYMSSFDAEELYEARRLLELTVSIDPTYARAHALLSWAHLTAWLQPLDGDYFNPTALEKAFQTACTAVQLDPNLPEGHAQYGYVLTWKLQHDAAIAEFEKAVALNPNYTDWRFAATLVAAGEHARAVEVGRAHMRLDPFYPPLTCFWLGAAYYMLGQYSKAVPPLGECAARAPNLRSGHTWLAAAHAQLGHLEDTRKEAGEVLRIQPGYTIDGIQRQRSYFKLSADTEHLCHGLRRAGLPEREAADSGDSQPAPNPDAGIASHAPASNATPAPEPRSGCGVAPSPWLRGSIAGGLLITVLGSGGWLVWKQVRPEPKLDQPARKARTYDPRDLRRLITPGGKVTCGFRGCQMVPEGCYAVRNAGGRGFGGKIFCDQPPAAVETDKGASKAAEKAGDAKLAAAPKPDSPAERGAFDGTWEVRRVGPGCRHAVRTFAIRVIEGVVSGHRAWGSISGTVSSSGRVVFKHLSSMGDGVSLRYSATLAGASGLGTFEYPDSPCMGTITLRRSGPSGEPTKAW